MKMPILVVECNRKERKGHARFQDSCSNDFIAAFANTLRPWRLNRTADIKI